MLVTQVRSLLENPLHFFSHFLFISLYSNILFLYSEDFHHTEIRLLSLPVTRCHFLYSAYRKHSIYMIYPWDTRCVILFPPSPHPSLTDLNKTCLFFFLTGLLLLIFPPSIWDYFNTSDFKYNASATVVSWDPLGTLASPVHPDLLYQN